MINALIAAGAIGVIGYALITHLQHRGPRSRAGAGGDGGGGDSYSDRTSDGFAPGSWFSGDSSGSSTDGQQLLDSAIAAVADIAEAAATVGEAVAATEAAPILIQRNARL